MSFFESAMVFPFFCLLHLQQFTTCHSGMGQAFTLWTNNISNLWPAMLAKWAGHWCEIQRVWIVIYLLAMLGKKVFLSSWGKWGPLIVDDLKWGPFIFLFLVFLVWINAFGMESVFKNPVRHSWPRGVRNAWCCMLANPQNLDIGEMLQTPSDSPFAAALRASKIVLVVPNRHCSVYTRLWCGYEAFLAHEEGKTILIAKDSNLQEIRRLGFAFSIFTLCSHVSEEKSAFGPPTTDPILQVFFFAQCHSPIVVLLEEGISTDGSGCDGWNCAGSVFKADQLSVSFASFLVCRTWSSLGIVHPA